MNGRRGRSGAVTIRQVAAAAGVSRGTASRVISGSPLVSDRARAAVEAAIAELGFTPSPAARALSRGRSDTVALVLPEPNGRVLSDPFFAQVIVGLSAVLDQQELQMVLLLARPGEGTERIARYLLGKHVDGAVIASHHRDDELNARLTASPLPCVFIGRPLDVDAHSYVDMDNVGGARAAAEHLIERGRVRIATITGPQDMGAGLDRLTGWREAMHDAGLDDSAVAMGDFTEAGGAAAAGALLQTHPELDAIFVASDLMAVGAMRVLRGEGRRIPDDVAVVGFDDFAVAATTDPPLTTIAHPVAAMAARAGELLHDICAGSDPGEPVIFPAHLVHRSSA